MPVSPEALTLTLAGFMSGYYFRGAFVFMPAVQRRRPLWALSSGSAPGTSADMLGKLSLPVLLPALPTWLTQST
ncbi:hypothetical protein CGCVW01_v012381 [Colletotrichum viniferum]|nr:hypothetical protein CGCVW01_v012381 [Colletotrichum viniferum]